MLFIQSQQLEISHINMEALLARPRITDRRNHGPLYKGMSLDVGHCQKK